MYRFRYSNLICPSYTQTLHIIYSNVAYHIQQIAGNPPVSALPSRSINCRNMFTSYPAAVREAVREDRDHRPTHPASGWQLPSGQLPRDSALTAVVTPPPVPRSQYLSDHLRSSLLLNDPSDHISSTVTVMIILLTFSPREPGLAN